MSRRPGTYSTQDVLDYLEGNFAIPEDGFESDIEGFESNSDDDLEPEIIPPEDLTDMKLICVMLPWKMKKLTTQRMAKQERLEGQVTIRSKVWNGQMNLKMYQLFLSLETMLGQLQRALQKCLHWISFSSLLTTAC